MVYLLHLINKCFQMSINSYISSKILSLKHVNISLSGSETGAQNQILISGVFTIGKKNSLLSFVNNNLSQKLWMLLYPYLPFLPFGSSYFTVFHLIERRIQDVCRFSILSAGFCLILLTTLNTVVSPW